MEKIKKIMAAVDLSDYSEPLVRYTHDLANAMGAGITLVHVFNERDVLAIRGVLDIYDPTMGQSLINQKLDERRELVMKLVESVGAQQTVMDSIVRIGIPHLLILDAIKQEKPDLIVMGTKGRSNFADTLVGSCARKIFRRSPVPVLLLPLTVETASKMRLPEIDADAHNG